MRIALVSDTYRPRINGVVVSVDAFAGEFRRLGHDVRIIAPEFPEYEQACDVATVKSHYLFFDPEDRLANPWLKSARKSVKREVLRPAFDIIHTQTPFTLGYAAIKWAKHHQCPIVHTYHTLFESYAHYIKFLPRSFTVGVTHRFSRWYCNQMDLVITPSQHMKDKLSEYDIETPIEVNGTGIDLERFEQGDGAAFRRKYRISDDTVMLLFIGRVAWEKNIAFLFDVMQELKPKVPKIKLVIAGEGPAKKALEARAKRDGLADDIWFLGYFGPDDLVNCYAAADIFTFASMTETQGLVVTEAMAAGTPVVAVRRMGVAEVMADEKGGVLVEPEVAEFTQAVLKMITDKDYYRQKQAETGDAAYAWSSQQMAKKMLGHYQQLLAKPGKHAYDS